MICENCGWEIPDGTDVCYNCGSSLSVVVNDTNQIEDAANRNKSENTFNLNNHFKKIKRNTDHLAKSATDFVENASESFFNESSYDNFIKKDYDKSLEYIRKNKFTKIEFAVDDSSKEKLSKLLAPDVIGGAGGLIGAAATVGIVGTTVGTGLIVVGAGALIGGLIAKHYNNISWIDAELHFWNDEIVISGKYSIPYKDIKHIGVKQGEIVVLTLNDQAIEFRTFNADATKTFLNEKIDEYYSI